MHISIHFKSDNKQHKEHYNVIETYVCPLDKEFNVHTINDTIRYDFEEISSITVNE